MADPFRRLGTDLRRIVNEGLRNGDPLELILSRVRELFAGLAIDTVLQQQFLAEASSQYEWIGSRSMSPVQQQDMLTLLQSTGAGFASIGGQIDEDLVAEVARGIRENLPSEEIENVVLRRVNKGRAQARTVTLTALQGAARADRFAQAQNAGVQRFKYVGPPPDRAKCKEWYKRIYTLDEIKRLDNGQVSPVRLYCGGYNCRHQWLPVID